MIALALAFALLSQFEEALIDLEKCHEKINKCNAELSKTSSIADAWRAADLKNRRAALHWKDLAETRLVLINTLEADAVGAKAVREHLEKVIEKQPASASPSDPVPLWAALAIIGGVFGGAGGAWLGDQVTQESLGPVLGATLGAVLVSSFAAGVPTALELLLQ